MKYGIMFASLGGQCSNRKGIQGMMLSRCHDLGHHSRQGKPGPHYCLALLVPFAVMRHALGKLSAGMQGGDVNCAWRKMHPCL